MFAPSFLYTNMNNTSTVTMSQDNLTGLGYGLHTQEIWGDETKGYKPAWTGVCLKKKFTNGTTITVQYLCRYQCKSVIMIQHTEIKRLRTSYKCSSHHVVLWQYHWLIKSGGKIHVSEQKRRRKLIHCPLWPLLSLCTSWPEKIHSLLRAKNHT